MDPTLIRTPTLLLSGTASPRSARGVIEILADKVEGAILHRLEGAGHMAPVTHADAVNELVEKHIESHEA